MPFNEAPVEVIFCLLSTLMQVITCNKPTVFLVMGFFLTIHRVNVYTFTECPCQSIQRRERGEKVWDAVRSSNEGISKRKPREEREKRFLYYTCITCKSIHCIIQGGELNSTVETTVTRTRIAAGPFCRQPILSPYEFFDWKKQPKWKGHTKRNSEPYYTSLIRGRQIDRVSLFLI